MQSHTSSLRAVIGSRVAIVMLGGAMFAGCAAQPSTPGALTSATTQPTTAPVQLNQLDKLLSQAQSFVTMLGGTLQTAAAAAQDPVLRAAASAIPYGSLALGILGVVAAVVKQTQATTATQQQQQTQKALTQVVSAMDAAIPSPTPEQQSKIAGVLDTDVKAQVAAARAS
jgi:hypothetical protein